MSVTLTAVGTPESDNWREEMPIWAHMIWWEKRKNSPYLRSARLISYVGGDSDYGCIITDLSQISISRHGYGA